MKTDRDARVWIPIGLLLLAIGAGGCLRPRTPRVEPRIEPGPSENCYLLPGEARPGGRLRFALADSVFASAAPHPRNASERIVFANIYETLVNANCGGLPKPGLAEWWTSSDSARVWTFSCREDARFSDGSPITAADVTESWRENRRRDRALGRTLPWSWLDAYDASFEAQGGLIVMITLSAPREDLPLLLAHPAFAVTKKVPGERWRLGTGAFRVERTGGPDGLDLICVPNVHHEAPPSLETLVFKVRPGWDQRDLVSDGVDALFVRDRSVLSYFRSAGGFETTGLLPDRTYTLLAPPAGDDNGRSLGGRLDGLDTAALAREVVVSDAAAANTLFFRNPRSDSCLLLIDPPPAEPAGGGGAGGGRIVYPAGDLDARRIAERIAALARDENGEPEERAAVAPPLVAPTEAPIIAAPLSESEFEAAFRSGGELAFILPLQRGEFTACLELSALLSRADWLARAALSRSGGRAFAARTPIRNEEAIEQGLIASGTAAALVTTRASLLTRRGVTGVQLAYDGALRLERAGWTPQDEMP